ncbi:hypothetical protein KME66_20320 [Streptomyces sp. YPW6]|uniref:hypothetical protein n=1 Tax=Streptomyces sp. YPW6 TaxID=2840373 RepID=UPI001C0C65F2|nr:hypothetical protein [Streptomyces sp. YPW6]QWQ43059.1 hypothetical protein KME66_20320 [Streptomyces sp. YPW6]
MTYKISTPVSEFNGQVAGVWFVNGEAETDSEGAVAYFERHGYTVEPVGSAPADDGDQGDGDKQAPAEPKPKPATRAAKGG